MRKPAMQNEKHFLVVGGTSGIGLELVRKLSEEADVTVWSRNTPENLPPGVTHDCWDATTGEETPPVPAKLTGMAYCPGSIKLKPVARLSDEDLRADFELNCLGAMRAVRACLQALRKQTASNIVLFSTVAVGRGFPMHASIAAAKGAVEGLTRSLAAELAPRIRVNAIAPSLVDTPLSAALTADEKRREAAAKRHPLQRIGSAGEIADAALYLLNGRLGWMTGQILRLDGGISSVRTPS